MAEGDIYYKVWKKSTQKDVASIRVSKHNYKTYAGARKVADKVHGAWVDKYRERENYGCSEDEHEQYLGQENFPPAATCHTCGNSLYEHDTAVLVTVTQGAIENGDFMKSPDLKAKAEALCVDCTPFL